ncbi:MAG: DUF4369 domain-containing protein [Bacteroidales bacterium]|nr:DUF4369 domain-containing protein [Bacteroidales bacterium]
MKKILYLLVLCMALAACHSDKNRIVIEGTLANAGREQIRLAVILPDGNRFIDSTKLKNGQFRFEIQARSQSEKSRAATPMMYQISLSDDNTLTTIAKGGDHIRITANAEKLIRGYHVEGGEEAVLVGQLDSALALFADSSDRLLVLFQQYMDNDSVREHIEQTYIPMTEKHKVYLADFIRQHPDKMASYIALYQSYNRRYFFNEEEKLEMLKQLNESLQRQYPDNPYLLEMQQHLEVLTLREQYKQRYDTD